MITEADYAARAKFLGAPIPHVKAIAQVESSGLTFWPIGGRMLPPVRLEAHRFGYHTGYRFNATHPDLSSREWNPGVAARTWIEAYEQLERARHLDREAANKSTSWGGFQVMGENAERLGYANVDAFVASMDTEVGQFDAFVRFIAADPVLKRALAIGDWRTVTRLYNGEGQIDAYSAKLEAAAAHFAGSAPGTVPRVLKIGDRGDDVARLQAALHITADGAFGPKTDEAVRRYQNTHGLVVDGLVGPMTFRTLGMGS